MTTDFSKRRNFIPLVSRLTGAHAHKRSSLGSRDFGCICNKLVEETYASFDGLHNEPLRFGIMFTASLRSAPLRQQAPM